MKPMLARQPAPSCEYRSAGESGRRQTGSQPTAADTDPEQQRAKLDYERQCYRHAEIIARARLRGLQEAVGATTKAAKAAEVSPPQQQP